MLERRAPTRPHPMTMTRMSSLLKVATRQRLSPFVCQENHWPKEQDYGPVLPAQGPHAEEVPQRRQVNEGQGHRRLKGYAPEDEAVAEEADLMDGGPQGAAGEDRPHLGADNSQEGHSSGLQVKRVLPRKRLAPGPAPLFENPEKASHDEDGLDYPEK